MRTIYLLFSFDEIRVLVNEATPHPFGVIDILAEHDRLVIPAGIFQEIRDFPGDEFCSLLKDKAGRNPSHYRYGHRSFAILILHPAGRSPSMQILVEIDPVDPVRGEEPVLDPLLQGIHVHRRTKIIDIGECTLSPLESLSGRCGSHSRNNRGSPATSHRPQHSPGGTRRR